MNFAEMSIEEMEARLSAIPAEAENAEDDVQTALLEEARGIKAEMERRKAAEAQKKETRDAVANGKGVVEQDFTKGEKTEMTLEEIRNSHEYNVAYATTSRPSATMSAAPSCPHRSRADRFPSPPMSRAESAPLGSAPG